MTFQTTRMYYSPFVPFDFFMCCSSVNIITTSRAANPGEGKELAE